MEEVEIGVRCSAAGIYYDSGELVTANSLSTTAARINPDWVPLVRASATMGLHAKAYLSRER